jgi:cell wall-associated NlpC family hydrolase
VPDPKEQELQQKVDLSKAVQKRRHETKSAAWKVYLAARERYRRRVQITKARKLKLKTYRDSKISGATKAVAWALDQVGTVEQPAFSNRGPKIDAWSTATLGFSGFAWCQSFANAVLVAGGGQQLKTAYTPTGVQWANEKKYGLRRVMSPRPGDFVYFKFPGVSNAFCDHVGVYVGNGQTIEGNTSSGSQGSQNNGGGVYLRTRPRHQMVAFVRPTYK